MAKDIFADTLVSCFVLGDNNMVHLEFSSIQPHLKSDQNMPVVEPVANMVIPLGGFLEAFNIMDSTVQQLVAKGLIARKEADKPAAHLAAETDTEPAAAGPSKDDAGLIHPAVEGAGEVEAESPSTDDNNKGAPIAAAAVAADAGDAESDSAAAAIDQGSTGGRTQGGKLHQALAARKSSVRRNPQ